MMRMLARLLPVVLLASFLPALPPAIAGDQPRASGITETTEVRRAQVDVTVLDPRGRGSRPVNDLRKEDFILYLDGKRLSPEEFAAVEFDRICGESSVLSPASRAEGAEGAATSLLVPKLVVFVDMNFLDTAARHRVHDALLALADRLFHEPLRVRVFAYGRRLFPLTPGFTDDPEVLRTAARLLLETSVPGPPLGETDAARGWEETDDPLLTGSDTRIFREIQQEGSYLAGMGSPGEMLFALDRRADPRHSIAAIRQVLLAHAGIPGRKGLVVFTSPWFDLPRDMQLEAMNSLHRAAQAGFSIYMVDARGLGHGGEESTLMSWLANTTGGQVVRMAGNLDIAFQRVLGQLQCYYLFSVPVPAPEKGTRAYDVQVKLDTAAHREYWRYRVQHRSTVYVDSAGERGVERRLEALLDPLSHPLPEVRLEASWPAPPDRVTVLETAVRLADLAFLPVDGSPDVAARIAIEGLVSTIDGKPVCGLGDRRVHQVRLPRAPEPGAPARLVLRQPCRVPGAGRYEVRVAVHDLQEGRVGAALGTFEVADPRGRKARLLRVSGVRLGFNSGGEFLLDVARGRAADVVAPRDRERQAFVPVRGDEPLPPGSRVSLRFVLCGGGPLPRAVLWRREPGSPPRVHSQVALHPRGPADPATGCRELEAVVPGGTLDAGAWGIALLEAGPETGSRAGIDRALADGAWLAMRTFTLAAPGEDAENSASR